MWKGNLPIFSLLDDAGRDVGTERLWQKHEMLVALLDTESCVVCEALEEALCADDDEWSRQNAGLVLLPIGADGGQLAHLVDLVYETLEPIGVVRGDPVVVVADRFGRVGAAIDVHADVDEVMREAHAWIDFVQEQCEECGVPIEPHTEAPLADSADDGIG